MTESQKFYAPGKARGRKAAEDRRTPKPAGHREASWSAPVLGRFWSVCTGREKSNYLAFTLVELLVTIAIIGILAALLLPALAQAKTKAQRMTCMNNQKQLQLAWQMYADQSGGLLASNDWNYRSPSVVEAPPGSWVIGNAVMDTNLSDITGGSLYPYVKSAQTYKCPMDPGLVLGAGTPTLRSYSLSCYMAGPPEDDEFGVNPLTRIGQIQKTSTALTFIEEDYSTIDDGHFLYSTTVTNWYNVPSWRHENGDVLAFADGHLEYWKWTGPRPSASYVQNGAAAPANTLADLMRLLQTAPVSN